MTAPASSSLRRRPGRPPCCSPEARQRIRELKDEGRSLRHIARVLNDEGLPTPTAQAKWDKSHVWRVPGALASLGVRVRDTADPPLPQRRGARLLLKVSGCMRSMVGAEEFCAIRSYLHTAARHGLGALDAITRALRGQPWIPETG